MLSGLKNSKKKTSMFAEERFAVKKKAYMQIFIDYLHAQNPYKLKFFDGCGLKLPFTKNDCMDTLLLAKGV